MNMDPGCVRPLLARYNSLCPKKKLLQTRSERVKQLLQTKYSAADKEIMKAAKRDRRVGYRSRNRSFTTRHGNSIQDKQTTDRRLQLHRPVRNQQGEIAGSQE